MASRIRWSSGGEYWFVAVLICFYLFALSNRACHSQGEDLTLDDILDRQQQRQSAIETLVLRCEGTRTLVRGQTDGEYPFEDVNLDKSYRVILKAGSSSIEMTADQWHFGKRSVDRGLEKIFVFDEKKRIGKKHQVTSRNGVIARHSLADGDGLLGILTMAYVPEPEYMTHPRMAVIRKQMTQRGEAIVVGNTDYNQTELNGATRTEFYFDAETLMPVRMTRMWPDGTVVVNVSVEYRDEQMKGLIPVSAKETWMKDNQIQESTEVTVSEFRINAPVEDSEFSLEFPPGITVSDRIAGVQYTIGPSGDGKNAPSRSNKWVNEVLEDIEVLEKEKTVVSARRKDGQSVIKEDVDDETSPNSGLEKVEGDGGTLPAVVAAAAIAFVIVSCIWLLRQRRRGQRRGL